jgi:hypothetical protein
MKELSKVPLIKKIIALDPRNPGVISKQRYTNSDGKKSKVYYSWQTSLLGEKITERIPKESARQIQNAIKAAETKTRTDDNKLVSTLKSYRAALTRLMEKNKQIREKNGSNPISSGKKDKTNKEAPKKSDVKKIDRLINKLSSKS